MKTVIWSDKRASFRRQRKIQTCLIYSFSPAVLKTAAISQASDIACWLRQFLASRGELSGTLSVCSPRGRLLDLRGFHPFRQKKVSTWFVFVFGVFPFWIISPKLRATSGSRGFGPRSNGAAVKVVDEKLMQNVLWQRRRGWFTKPGQSIAVVMSPTLGIRGNYSSRVHQTYIVKRP